MLYQKGITSFIKSLFLYKYEFSIASFSAGPYCEASQTAGMPTTVGWADGSLRTKGRTVRTE